MIITQFKLDTFYLFTAIFVIEQVRRPCRALFSAGLITVPHWAIKSWFIYNIKIWFALILIVILWYLSWWIVFVFTGAHNFWCTFCNILWSHSNCAKSVFRVPCCEIKTIKNKLDGFRFLIDVSFNGGLYIAISESI